MGSSPVSSSSSTPTSSTSLEELNQLTGNANNLTNFTTTPTARDLPLISLIFHNKRRSHRRLAIGLTVLTLDCSPRRHWTWNVYLLINLFKFSLSAFLSMEPLSTGVTSWSLPCSTLRSSPFRSAVAFRILGDTASTPTILDHFPTFPYSFLASATTTLDPQWNSTLLAFAFSRQHPPAPTVPVLSFTVVDLTAIIRDFGEAKYDAAASSQSTSTPQLRDHPLPLPFYLPFSPSEFRISLAFLNNARSSFQQRLYCPLSC